MTGEGREGEGEGREGGERGGRGKLIPTCMLVYSPEIMAVGSNLLEREVS